MGHFWSGVPEACFQTQELCMSTTPLLDLGACSDGSPVSLSPVSKGAEAAQQLHSGHTAMSVQVLAGSPQEHDSAAALLPDDLPGQANSSSSASSSTAAEEPFSLFAAPPAPPQATTGTRLLQRPNHRSIGVLRDPQVSKHKHAECLAFPSSALLCIFLMLGALHRDRTGVVTVLWGAHKSVLCELQSCADMQRGAALTLRRFAGAVQCGAWSKVGP